jgi:hypothetical protein
MAPNKRGGPPSRAVTSVISKEEIEARGSGTNESSDTYDSKRWVQCETRVFFTGKQTSTRKSSLLLDGQSEAHLACVTLAGLMFLTRLPCPGWCDHHPAYLMRSMMWFPLFGVLIGAWGAVWFNAFAVVLPASVAAGVSTLATVWFTGTARS